MKTSVTMLVALGVLVSQLYVGVASAQTADQTTDNVAVEPLLTELVHADAQAVSSSVKQAADNELLDWVNDIKVSLSLPAIVRSAADYASEMLPSLTGQQPE
ncbi:hypothetical protein NOG12_00090 [Pseudidiomarina sp. GXY010]|uniref:Uncharacterized protein n=1 Tax=Pseudidiomarina fusca TaxID=2965078 RepID=A0ABU3KUE3_9GAMM|nr:hypothetical protein [Pseudidiomarina sp. GXY010]MDT7524506.1 hypothetical protein [Pseudidiomarina sp. GXY010]